MNRSVERIAVRPLTRGFPASESRRLRTTTRTRMSSGFAGTLKEREAFPVSESRRWIRPTLGGGSDRGARFRGNLAP